MSNSSELLRILGAGARIGGVEGRIGAQPGPAGIEHADFSALLKKAQSGGMASRLPVTIEKGANVSLSEDELAGLAAVADRAEAAGVRSAVVMFPDKAILLDVHTRSVKGAADITSDVLAGVDGVIRIPAAGDPKARGAPPTLPAGGIGNASVARLLAKVS